MEQRSRMIAVFPEILIPGGSRSSRPGDKIVVEITRRRIVLI